MRRIPFFLVAIAMLLTLANISFAQDRTLGARRLLLDDGLLADPSVYLTNNLGSLGVDDAGIVTPGIFPSTCAILDLSSISKGFLPPRMTGAQEAAICGGTPPFGLIVYNTSSNSLDLFTPTGWTPFIGGNGWLLGGNIIPFGGTAPGGDYIGTNNAQDFVIASNGVERARFIGVAGPNQGDLGVNTTTPGALVDVNGTLNSTGNSTIATTAGTANNFGNGGAGTTNDIGNNATTNTIGNNAATNTIGTGAATNTFGDAATTSNDFGANLFASTNNFGTGGFFSINNLGTTGFGTTNNIGTNGLGTTNVFGPTNINTATNDATAIGSTTNTSGVTIASNNANAITLDVASTGNNLVLNNINNGALSTDVNFLVMTSPTSGNVRWRDLSSFIIGSNGVEVTYTGGVADAHFGPLNTSVPFTTDRFINTASNILHITNSTPADFATFNGGTNEVDINNTTNGTTDVGNGGGSNNIGNDAAANTFGDNTLGGTFTNNFGSMTGSPGSLDNEIGVNSSPGGFLPSLITNDIGNVTVGGGINTNNIGQAVAGSTANNNIGNTGGGSVTNTILGTTDINQTGGATTNIATTNPAITNIGVLGGTNTIAGTTTVNSSVNNNTSINAGTSTGTVTIGNAAAGAVTIQSNAGTAISLNVTNVANNLQLANIAAGTNADAAFLDITSLVTGNVRTRTISSIITGSQGVELTNTGSSTDAHLASSNANVLFTSARYINTDAFGLHITGSTGGAGTEFGTFNGSNGNIGLNNNAANTGTSTVGNTTAGGAVSLNTSGTNVTSVTGTSSLEGQGILSIGTAGVPNNLNIGQIDGARDYIQSFSNYILNLNPVGNAVTVHSQVTNGTIGSSELLQVSGNENPINGDAHQLVITGANGGNQMLELGYNTTGNNGTIQSFNQTVGTTNLVVQPVGGRTLVGNAGAGAISRLQVVGATSDLTGVAPYANGPDNGWDLYVAGDAQVTGILKLGTASMIADASNNSITGYNGNGLSLAAVTGGAPVNITAGAGGNINMTGTTLINSSNLLSTTIGNGGSSQHLIINGAVDAAASDLAGNIHWDLQVNGDQLVTGTLKANNLVLTPFTPGAVIFAGASGQLSQDVTPGGQFFWDGTNHRLGIGTAAPGWPLDIVGVSNFQGLVRANNGINVLGGGITVNGGSTLNNGTILNNGTTINNLASAADDWATTTPASSGGIVHTLQISTLPFVGGVMPVASPAGNYIINAANDYAVLATGGNKVTLPTAVGNSGKIYVVKHTAGGGNVTVVAPGVQTIDGGANDLLALNSSHTYLSDGANWFIIAF